MEILLTIGFGILVVAVRLLPVLSNRRRTWVGGVFVLLGVVSLLIGIFYRVFPVVPIVGNVLVNTVAVPLIILGITMFIQDNVENNPNNRVTLRYGVLITALIGTLTILAYLLYWSLWILKPSQNITAGFVALVAILVVIWFVSMILRIKARTKEAMSKTD